MTRLPLSIAVSPPLRHRAASAWCTVLALGLLAVPVAQAAVTQGGGVDGSPSAFGAGTRPLDRALGVELTTGDRHLDLLLESQRKPGDRPPQAPASQPAADRSDPSDPSGPSVRADRSAPGQAALPPLSLSASAAASAAALPAGQDTVRRWEPPVALPERGAWGGASLPAPKAAREGAGGNGRVAVAVTDPRANANGDASRLRSMARPLHTWVQERVAWVKDHLLSIVLAVAAIALMALGLKAYSRRI